MASFDVYLDVCLTMRYRVDDVTSPDEAESIAERWAEQGVKGAIVEREVLPGAAEPARDEDDSDDPAECDPYEEDE